MREFLVPRVIVGLMYAATLAVVVMVLGGISVTVFAGELGDRADETACAQSSVCESRVLERLAAQTAALQADKNKAQIEFWMLGGADSNLKSYLKDCNGSNFIATRKAVAEIAASGSSAAVKSHAQAVLSRYPNSGMIERLLKFIDSGVCQP